MTGLPNILDYGGNNNNAADNDAALRNTLAANAAYPTCFFPPGKYRFASNFNYGPVNAAAPTPIMTLAPDTGTRALSIRS